jgi:ribosomal protein S18 acetylase RimI-like enzyme
MENNMIEARVDNGITVYELEGKDIVHLPELEALRLQLGPDIRPLTDLGFDCLVQKPNRAFVITSESGTIVGFIGLCLPAALSGDFGFIVDLVVDESHQNQGYAQALLEMHELAAREAGRQAQVSLTNPSFHPLAFEKYKKFGFRVEEARVVMIRPLLPLPPT